MRSIGQQRLRRLGHLKAKEQQVEVSRHVSTLSGEKEEKITLSLDRYSKIE